VEQAWRVDLVNRLRAAGARPRLVAALYLRNEPVLLYRFSWAEELGYRPSDFERARLIEDDEGSAAAEKAFEAAGASSYVDLILARVRALVHGGHGEDAPAVARLASIRLPFEPEVARLVLDLDHLYGTSSPGTIAVTSSR
jgi:hypothetical protein